MVVTCSLECKQITSVSLSCQIPEVYPVNADKTGENQWEDEPAVSVKMDILGGDGAASGESEAVQLLQAWV